MDQPDRAPEPDLGETSPGLGTVFLAILGVWGIGYAQPFFALIGDNPTFFVAHRSGRGEIILVTALVYLVPPVVLFGLTALVARLAPRQAKLLITVGLALLLAVGISGYAWRPLDLQIEPALPLLLAVLAISFLALRRFGGAMRLLANLGWISLAFPALFLFLSPVAELVLGSAAQAKADAAFGPGAGNDTSVVLVVFDELPLSSMLDETGGIDRGRLPNFARLADRSTWYSDTTSVSTQTTVAVPAILTGTVHETAMVPPQEYPSNLFTDKPPTDAHYPRSLFTDLASSHDLVTWETVTRLCPPGVCGEPLPTEVGVLLDDSWIVLQQLVLPPGVAQRWVPEINSQWTSFRAPRVLRGKPDVETEWEFPWSDLRTNHPTQFREFAELIGRTSEPTLWYEHVSLPHVPWIHRPDGSSHGAEPIEWLDDAVWPGADHERGVLMHAMQVEFVDALMGDLLDRLEASGRFDEMLVVVVADHGAALREGFSLRTWNGETSAELARVPLFVKYPEQATGTVDTRPAEITDVYATIADVLNVEVAEPILGRSLRDDPEPSRPRALASAPAEFDAAVDRFHAIVAPGTSAEIPYDRKFAE